MGFIWNRQCECCDHTVCAYTFGRFEKWQFLFRNQCDRIVCAGSIRSKSANADVVNDLFDFLHIVLQGIETFAQPIIFQVQQAKTGTQIANKSRYLQWTLIIAQSNCVRCESRQFGCHLQCSHQIVFDVQVESIFLRCFHWRIEQIKKKSKNEKTTVTIWCFVTYNQEFRRQCRASPKIQLQGKRSTRSRIRYAATGNANGRSTDSIVHLVQFVPISHNIRDIFRTVHAPLDSQPTLKAPIESRMNEYWIIDEKWHSNLPPVMLAWIICNASAASRADASMSLTMVRISCKKAK